jgi:hypothetical protein
MQAIVSVQSERAQRKHTIEALAMDTLVIAAVVWVRLASFADPSAQTPAFIVVHQILSAGNTVSIAQADRQYRGSAWRQATAP